MEYTCSLCGEKVGKDLLVFIDHTDQHIIEAIKAKHPEWADENGLCKKCEAYFREQLRGH